MQQHMQPQRQLQQRPYHIEYGTMEILLWQLLLRAVTRANAIAFLWVCEYMCVYIYIYIHIHIHVYIYIYTYIYIYIYTCIVTPSCLTCNSFLVYVYIFIYRTIRSCLIHNSFEVQATEVVRNTKTICIYIYIYMCVYIQGLFRDFSVTFSWLFVACIRETCTCIYMYIWR